jgi:hypothetical protein
MGSIPHYMASQLNTPPVTNCWVSPSRGLRKQGDRWTVHASGKQVGAFDAIVIAHNGKCADRLTSKTPAKRLNALLKVQFNDQPSTTKMTLNSIYSLVVNIKKKRHPR